SPEGGAFLDCGGSRSEAEPERSGDRRSQTAEGNRSATPLFEVQERLAPLFACPKPPRASWHAWPPRAILNRPLVSPSEDATLRGDSRCEPTFFDACCSFLRP